MKKLLYLAFILPLCMFSCNEDEIMTFEDEDAGIYFQTGQQQRFYINIDAYYDSIPVEWGRIADHITDTVLYTRLRTMGKVRDYDRKVRVVVDQENTTAVEGVHYRVDFSNIVVPAGAAEVQVPVTFLRDKSLLTQEYRLMLKVEDNENFNEFYVEPVIWSFFSYAWPDGINPCGVWSIKKQKLMSQLFNITEDDWDYEKGWANNKGVQMMSFNYYAVKLRVYLQQLADAGTPVREDDGSFMQLGPGYEVDYSAYSN